MKFGRDRIEFDVFLLVIVRTATQIDEHQQVDFYFAEDFHRIIVADPRSK